MALRGSGPVQAPLGGIPRGVQHGVNGHGAAVVPVKRASDASSRFLALRFLCSLRCRLASRPSFTKRWRQPSVVLGPTSWGRASSTSVRFSPWGPWSAFSSTRAWRCLQTAALSSEMWPSAPRDGVPAASPLPANRRHRLSALRRTRAMGRCSSGSPWPIDGGDGQACRSGRALARSAAIFGALLKPRQMCRAYSSGVLRCMLRMVQRALAGR